MTLPRRFGRYLLVDRLAMGGMAEIYEARLIGVAGFEKTLAIKQILPQWSERPAFIKMLIDEAKIAVRLNHPNVVEVYELGREGGQYYIAMELVDGIDLSEIQRRCRVSGRRLPLQLAVRIVQEVAQALHYAHQLTDTEGRPLELIHRDISPQNILVSFEGRVKVTDFGIAKAIDREHETVTGTFKGKFAYMSPEQARQTVIDQRSDLFSLGIVFYELVTGQRLFQGKSDLEVLDQVRNAHIPCDNSAFETLRPSLQELIRSLLALDPNMRPSDAGQLLLRLNQIADEMELHAHRSALAHFIQELFLDRLQNTRENLRLQRSKIEDFLDQAPTAALREERETTATVPPETNGTQILVDDWSRYPHVARRPFLGPWMWSLSTLGVLAALMALWMLWSTDRPPDLSLTEAVEAPRTPPEYKPTGYIPNAGQPLHDQDPWRSPPTVDALQAIAAQDPLNNADATVSHVETKPPSVTPRGKLSVQAIPWGYVYLDGRTKRHETPLRLLSLSAGEHTLQVVHQASGESVQRKIDISGGKSVTCIAHFGDQKRIECR